MTNESFGGASPAVKWSRIAQNVGFGAAGGLMGFFLSEALIDSDAADMSKNQMRIETGYWFALIVLAIGLAIVGAQAFMNRIPPTVENVLIGVGAFLLGGFISGYVAQLVYENMVNWESGPSTSDLRIPRAIGWLIAGGLGGGAVGLAFRSVKRVQNGVMGGAAGGIVGGLLFDSFGTASTARLFGIVLVGSLMGGLIGLIETARTALWLSVMSGELRGRQVPIVDQVTSVGRARSNRVCLPGDQGILEKHLEIRLESTGASFSSSGGPIGHNQIPSVSGRLNHGDLLVIGRTEVRVELRKGSPPAMTTAKTPAPPGLGIAIDRSEMPVPVTRPASHRPTAPTSAGPRPIIPVQRPD